MSSVRLAKDIGVTQKAAWFMLRRLRETREKLDAFEGRVEIDETHVGGLHLVNKQQPEGPALANLQKLVV